MRRAQRLPLHPHNAPLQIWLELGAVGWLLMAGLVAAALLAVARGLRAGDTLAWAYGVALLGFLAVGALISVSEVPRVMLLALLSVVMPLILWTNRRTDTL